METNARVTMLKAQTIYCGDSLKALRSFQNGTVDLVYLDPPFSNKHDYNKFWAGSREKPSSKEQLNSAKSYIKWIRPFILEIRRVLQDTGSLYYHCDTHISAHVRLLLDEVFGTSNFRSQIVWQTNIIRSTFKHAFSNNYDTIFYYTKSDKYTFNQYFTISDETRLSNIYRHQEENTGRRYRLVDLTSNTKDSSGLYYEFLGVTRSWRWTKEKMQEAYEQGMIIQTRPGSVPALKQYLDEYEGIPLTNLWLNIPPLRSSSRESIGYPAQRPIALLERIISVSSNEDDFVFDPFCGSGTTLYTAQKLGRKWAGIDISPTACRISARRLSDVGLKEGDDFLLYDLPKTAEELRDYPASEFESWAANALNTIIYDRTLEGFEMGSTTYPISVDIRGVFGKDLIQLSTQIIPIEVKQRDNIGTPDIHQFGVAVKHHKTSKGIFIAFSFSDSAYLEVDRMRKHEGIDVSLFTVQHILEQQLTSYNSQL